MSRNDFFDIENQIRHAVDSAFDCIDLVNDAAKDAINEVRNCIKDKSYYYNNVNFKDNGIYEPMNGQSNYISKKEPGKYTALALRIAGVTGSIIFGFLIIGYVIFQQVFLEFIGIDGIVGLVILLLFLGCSILIDGKGKSIKNRNKRFEIYADHLRGKNYCEIKELAFAVNKNSKFVTKDLGRMIELNMFKEPYFDDDKTYFMLGREVYEAYLSSKESMKERENEDNIKEDFKSELDEVVQIGERYIEEIRNANKAIEGKVISAKLDKLECIVRAIFDYIEKNSNKIPDVKKFINHYLPITLKLVNSYKELDAQMIQGENIKKAKSEIEKSLDLVNSAFEKMLNNLFEEVAIDVSSDISVLKTLFTQEGLIDNDFNNKK